ncbi:hypothetical protein GLOIN_2v1766614 [Rhizophagus clarus]|nr:hypothetical protein GLOIN_2v1766614 [Rhizophagus clarus]
MAKLSLNDAIGIAKSHGESLAFQELAHARNGKCISEKYVNNSLPLLWECENKHKFHLSLASVKNQGNWCRECMKLGLKFAQNLANERNGTCLSSSYHNRRTPLSWECSKGHSWLARIDSIQRGTWCPYCVRENARLGIEYAKKLANSKNGECLSNVYTNRRTYLHWKCSKSHEWYASINTIKNNNSWCPHCANTKLDISVAKDIAYSRGGKCLSDSYIDCNSRLLWRCNKDHQCKVSWSPSEKRRPDFLKIPEHPKGLELDIPYYHYGFAIEVQGEQHDKYIEFFHRGDPNNFIRQQERDQLKKELCEENCINLKYVWYYEDPHIVIPEYLRELGLIE